MKKHLPLNLIKYVVLITLITFFTFFYTDAQQRQISLTGFNGDAIADPVLNATASTLVTIALDGDGGNVFFTQGYSNNDAPETNGLPVDGKFTSPSGHSFQLAPYDSSNVLQVDFFNNFSGTLTFSNPDQVAYDSIFIAATGGGGATFVSYQINFTDNSYTSGNFTAVDWFCNGCSSYALNNLSRISAVSGNVNQAGKFAIYEYPIILSSTDNLKSISSIDFSAPNDGSSYANIFAITGYASGALPVSLLYYTVSLKNGEALLQWKTASEQNNSQFIVERASSASPNVFTQIGNVQATSFANGSVYSFQNAPGLAGTYLYKLIQQDVDGNKKVLGVRSISFSNRTKWILQDLGTQWKLGATGAYTYRLTDMNGRTLQLASGNGTTTITKPTTKGIYLLQAWANGESFVQKVIN